MSRLLSNYRVLFHTPAGRSSLRVLNETKNKLEFNVKVREIESGLGFHSSACCVQPLYPRQKGEPCEGCRYFSSYSNNSPLLSSQKTLLSGSKQHSESRRSLLKQSSEEWHEMSSKERAEKFQRPKAQTTIDEEEVSKFSSLSALWWDEGGEFEALHSLNELRVPLIRNGLVSKISLDKYNMIKPLEGCWILDVGSGGGIFSEPLARLGASVIGLEASEENIKIAQAHLIHDPAIREQIKYIHATVEDIAEDQAGKFDAVVASEVLEHVADADTFISSACKLVKPGGSVFFTTLNKTAVSYALGIVVAERVLRLVSPGTHDWQKFIAPRDLQFMLEKNNFSTKLLHGMWYNPLSKRWSWTKDTSINYAIHAVRALEDDVTPPEDTAGHEGTPQSEV